MNDNYQAWLITLKNILKQRSANYENTISQPDSKDTNISDQGPAIHRVQAEFIKHKISFINSLSGKTPEEIAKLIVFGSGLEAENLFSALGFIHRITPEDMTQPASNIKLINAAVSMLTFWNFHIMTLYRFEGDAYRRTSIDITGRAFEDDITADEFSTYRNASLVSDAMLVPGEFSMKMSGVWQPGHGDDLAFRLDDSYIMSFTDVDDRSRKLTPHEITGLSLAAWTLSEKIKGRRDHLTGLVNRRAWNEFAVAGDPADGYYLMAAVDGFKNINDRYGHIRGDAVIRITGRILKSTFGGEDRIYRWSGAEFLVRSSRNNISELADLFRSSVESYDFSTIGIESRVTVSAGISRITSIDRNTEDYAYEREKNALNRADSGVGAAKKNGRNRVEFIM